MDEYSSRRPASRLVISGKSSSLVLRNSTESPKDRNAQVCSRAGCSSKLNPMKPSQMGSPSKTKTSKAPFRPAGHSKEVIGSSSKTPALVNTPRKPISVPKKKFHSRTETDSPSGSVREENESVEPKSAEAGSSSSTSSNKPVKRNTRRFGLDREQSSTGSSSSPSFRQASQGTRNLGDASTSKCNMRTLKCNSISDVSSTESNVSKRKDIGRKRVGEPESSLSARGKKINGSMIDDKRSDSSSQHGISISDSRRSRNSSRAVDNDTSYVTVRAQRVTPRTRIENQENRRRLPMGESPLMTQSSPRPDISFDPTSFSSENQFSVQNSSSHASSFSGQGNSGDHMRPNRSYAYEVGSSRSFVNWDSLRQYNFDGIAEMLLALERIDREEELTYEQLLALENNLFLGGIAFHDQHRDMRLDIDDMSYEELLALEERMGTVITAVPEEDLRKCLDRTTYLGIADNRKNEDDVKCSICQEEYGGGEEVGRLNCHHRYHVDCIHQWLRLKNWCPICKASVSTSPSPLLA